MLRLFADIAQELAQVESIMRQQLRKKRPALPNSSISWVSSMKRCCAPLSSSSLPEAWVKISDHHRSLAAALELIHTATLVHDDMIDGGEVRRGTPTPHVRFGNSTAILWVTFSIPAPLI